jgi:ribonuclease-3
MPEAFLEISGYFFKNPSLLRRALTHASASTDNNERLEFLGDAVLGLVVAELLLEQAPPGYQEGDLTRARSRVVNREGLATAARLLDLGSRLTLGTSELQSNGCDKDRILCGALEAVAGAIFLDGGFLAVRSFSRHLLQDLIHESLIEAPQRNPRNELQEYSQQRGQGLPDYSLLSTQGEPHQPVFKVRVEVGCVMATGTGRSKKEAEREAASLALRTLRDHPDLLPFLPRGKSS